MQTARLATPKTVFALAAVLATASAAAAERLLSPVAGMRAPGAGGVTRVQTLALGRAALADLRARPRAAVPQFPIGADGTVELALRRWEPFAAGAHVTVFGADGVRDWDPTGTAYFVGTVNGDPRSHAMLAAGPDSVHGFVDTKGSVYVFGPDGAGAHRSYALRDVAPSALPPASDFCGNDLHPGGAVSRAFAADPHMIVERSTTVTAGSLLEVDMGIETDFELWAKFNTGQGDPTARLLDYVASLVAAGNTVFRELNVEVKIGYVHVYTNGPASDPWSTFSGTQTYVQQNQEVAQKYLNGSVQASGPHDVIHFLSGKKVQGGYSIVGSVCNWDGVSVTQVFGSFDPSNPDRIWDAMAFIHETGHTLGTLHSHCYTPTLDQCFSGEQVHWPDGTVTSCYVGKVVASHGTVMSYCHLLAPGYYNNTALEFGPTITAQIRKTIEPRQCLKVLSTCGDGVVEGDEECDDGNMVGGDGCSADCRLCGNGLLDAGEECDDGNESYDDGCTPSCRLEPCKILPATPGATVSQTAWWGARVAVTSTPTAGDKLNVRGTFALPAGSTIASGQLTLPDGTRVEPEQTGLRLVVESVARRKKLDLFLPPNDPSALPGVRQRWRRSPGSFVRSYTDAAGSVGGIQRVNVFVYPFGPPRVRLSIRGRNGGFGIAPWDVPLHLTVVLGDDATGLAGGCGHYAFAKGSCTSDGRHTRCR